VGCVEGMSDGFREGSSVRSIVGVAVGSRDG